MTVFRLTGGMHVDEKGEVFRSGDLVPSQKPLDKIFRNKFIKVSQEDLEQEKPPMPEKPPISKVAKKKKTAKKKKRKSKKDSEKIVTDQFPAASVVDLEVYQKGSRYNVKDPNTGNVVNAMMLKKAEVTPFLKAYEV